MLETPDYLKVGKAHPNCIRCGQSLMDSDRLASVLVPAELVEGSAEPSVPEEQPEEAPVAEKKASHAAKAGEKTSTAKGSDEEESRFSRHDFCTTCWEELKDQAYFSFWIAKRTASNLPPKKLSKAERNVALAALFESLQEKQEAGEDDFAPHLFFLAHLLMKFKIFKWQPGIITRDPDRPFLRFQKTQTGEEVLVPDVDMPDEMVVRIKGEVEQYLSETTGQQVKL